MAYDGAGQVSTVTDASTKRRLLFGYTSSQLTSLQFQVKVSGTFTTYHTTAYGYTSTNLTSVTIGGQLAQTNSYTSSYLTQVVDGAGTSIVSFAYNATPGKVARIDAQSGVLGYDYASTRASCSGKTVLYFNLGNATSCNVDGDCGSGFLCGGKTGTGSTGRCFRGARCFDVGSASEDVIYAVTALGPPSETCEGACLQASSYVWTTGYGGLDLAAVQSPTGSYTVKSFNTNGLPLQVTYGSPSPVLYDPDAARTKFLTYDTNFPGKIASVRWQSVDTSASCVAGGTTGCARTETSYQSSFGDSGSDRNSRS